MAATAVIGFVTDGKRKTVSRRIGVVPSSASRRVDSSNI